MKFGYVRTSTEDQIIDRQVDLLLQHGVELENIFVDQVTGATLDRPKFQVMVARLRPGDTIVTESLSRLSRSMEGLIQTVETWLENGITYISLKENIDFSTVTGRLLLGMLASISEFERNMIRERAMEGLRAARARGRVGGRPCKDPATIKKALKLYEAGVHSVGEIVILTGVSRALLYRKLREKRITSADAPKASADQSVKMAAKDSKVEC
jgi:DNA invertase Pin-like site-specific DNA recombinase